MRVGRLPSTLNRRRSDLPRFNVRVCRETLRAAQVPIDRYPAGIADRSRLALRLRVPNPQPLYELSTIRSEYHHSTMVIDHNCPTVVQYRDFRDAPYDTRHSLDGQTPLRSDAIGPRGSTYSCGTSATVQARHPQGMGRQRSRKLRVAPGAARPIASGFTGAAVPGGAP